MSFKEYSRFTEARILLGNTGAGLPTKAWLDFAFHHARAVDAIKIPWDIKKEARELKNQGLSSLILKTKITSREEYLRRPDLGCFLDDKSKTSLKRLGKLKKNGIAILVSNGLSSLAIINHLQKFFAVLKEEFAKEKLNLAHNLLLLAENGRVGLIDDVGEAIKPALGLVFLGERPGLSSPDSLAVYLTYRPKIGRYNSERNCVSNIRPPHGLHYDEAAKKIIFLTKEALQKKLSGTALKEEAFQLHD